MSERAAEAAAVARRRLQSRYRELGEILGRCEAGTATRLDVLQLSLELRVSILHPIKAPT
jgi:hypothetical protein